MAANLDIVFQGKDKTSQSIGSLTRQLKTLGTVAAGVAAAGLGAATFAAFKLSKAVFQSGSDVIEMQNKFNVVFGDETDATIKKLDELAASLGRNRFELREAASGFQDVLVPMGATREEGAKMSTQLVELAEDLASFNNMPTAAVMEDLQSAMIGNTERLKKYGIVATAAMLKQDALNQGYEGAIAAMDPMVKANLILERIVANSSDAQGDAARTALSWANQMKSLTAFLREFIDQIGANVVPHFEPFLVVVVKMVRSMKDWIPVISSVFQEIARFINIVGSTKEFQEFLELFKIFDVDTSGLIGTIRRISDMLSNFAVAILPTVTRAVAWLLENWRFFTGAVVKLGLVLSAAGISTIFGVIGGVLSAMVGPLALVSTGITALAMTVFTFVAPMRGQLMDFFGKVGKAFEFFSGSLRAGESVFQSLVFGLSRIIPMGTRTQDTLINAYDKIVTAWQSDGLSGALSAIGDLLRDAWTNIIWPQLQTWAVDFWNWASGSDSESVDARAEGEVTGFIGKISQLISNNWPTIRTALTEWSDKFWDWILGKDGS